jgi:hypothetical protein
MQFAILLTCVVFLTAAPIRAQIERIAPVFVFHTADFWLNLHHFLYVLGRHEAAMPDRTRRATAGAPADAERGLASVSPDEQRAWRAAVTFYAKGPSRQDAVFDEPLVNIGQALARAGPSRSLAPGAVDAPLAKMLEAVAPIYRQAWWPAHESANVEWATATTALVDAHGRAILDFITRAYRLPWPQNGYPIHVTAYTNWAGAFSTRGNLLLISSLDTGNRGLTSFEIAFHEAMHQWDDAITAVLQREAQLQNTTAPDLLSHALIWYTAAEAVRSVAPDHVGYAEANGLWKQRGLGAFKPALDTYWKPYLAGKGTRDEAFAAILTQIRPQMDADNTATDGRR